MPGLATAGWCLGPAETWPAPGPTPPPPRHAASHPAPRHPPPALAGTTSHGCGASQLCPCGRRCHGSRRVGGGTGRDIGPPCWGSRQPPAAAAPPPAQLGHRGSCERERAPGARRPAGGRRGHGARDEHLPVRAFATSTRTTITNGGSNGCPYPSPPPAPPGSSVRTLGALCPAGAGRLGPCAGGAAGCTSGAPLRVPATPRRAPAPPAPRGLPPRGVHGSRWHPGVATARARPRPSQWRATRQCAGARRCIRPSGPFAAAGPMLMAQHNRVFGVLQQLLLWRCPSVAPAVCGVRPGTHARTCVGIGVGVGAPWLANEATKLSE